MKFYPVNDKRDWYRSIYLKTQHWYDLRGRKLLCNPCCESCGSNQNLDVHHIRYRRILDVRLSDLLTLCRTCHEREHKRLEALRPRRKPRGWPTKRVFTPSTAARWIAEYKPYRWDNTKINKIKERIEYEALYPF